MTPPTIQLTLGRTGARLSLDQQGPRAASFGASNIEDAVRDAVRACVDLTRGRRDTGFLWRVDQSGVFVDIYLGARWARLVVFAGVAPAVYRDFPRPDGTLVTGHSLSMAVAAAAWVALLTAIGWWRVRRSGIPLR